jgi:hypothetical protein
VLALKKVLVFLVELALVVDQFGDGTDGEELFEDGVLMVLPEELHDAFDGEEVLGLELGPVLVDELDEPWR